MFKIMFQLYIYLLMNFRMKSLVINVAPVFAAYLWWMVLSADSFSSVAPNKIQQWGKTQNCLFRFLENAIWGEILLKIYFNKLFTDHLH